MPAPLSTRRVRDLLRDLRRLIADRAAAETATKSRLAERTAALRQAFERERDQRQAAFAAEHAALVAELQQARDRALIAAADGLKAVKGEYGATREDALDRARAEEEAATHEHQEARWAHEGVHEATAKQARAARHQAQRALNERGEAVKALREDVRRVLEHWKLVPQAVDTPADDSPLPGDVPAAIDEHITAARQQLAKLRGMIAPRLLVGDRLLWIAFAVWVAVALTGFVLTPWYLGPAIATAAAVGGGLLLRVGLAARSRSQSARLGAPLFRSLAEADRLRTRAERAGEEECRRAIAESERRCKEAVREADQVHRRQMTGIAQRRDATVTGAETSWRQRSTVLSSTRDAELARLDAEGAVRTAELDAREERELTTLAQQHERDQADTLKEFSRAFGQLVEDWHRGSAAARAEIEAIAEDDAGQFPDWHSPAWRDWEPAAAVPAGVRFGTLAVDVDRFPGARPEDARLQPFEPVRFAVPALLPFPHRCATLLRVRGAQVRASGVAALQTMAARFLTAVPPGKVRFTIVDPVGLGENFAAFMHLADHDERLVGSRIWTESAHIDKRLGDLTAHMENVIQKYLRNQYTSLEEYNAQAGEVAEPYRVLVVANFPTNFSLDAARRLVSIASSGAGCGVYTLVSVDLKQPMPQGFQLADLEQAGVILDWKDDKFVWRDPDFAELPLTIDAPPEQDILRAALDVVGKQAREAGRVEVDFEFIAPPAERWWTGDSRSGVAVPLGRAGATKRQYLQLGQGTSQHALVAGKTGSGKSTLLHALITNLALHYGPDEVELFLIDFKKGVEFKTYATHALPHARVVAVESEREFGLSVLQKLDAELKRRGDLFRNAGVQDIASYRDKVGGKAPPGATGGLAAIPRILLVVDEFQEFFVEDDKVSQEAALLLDRLVRQGRAFGLHVLLGSQTLGGAYSLARSTIDQMAVRIALQCSEADANLILSKDNNAARLLSRPGEAIYNDANGLLEGNDVFQVVWLPEERREGYLTRLTELARRRGWTPPGPAIVFEGNQPAELSGNARLRQLLAGDITPGRERIAWLGDALAIKDPTAAVFRRHTGSHLLVIGQQPDAARAVLTAAAIALAAQHAAAEDATSALPPVTVLDASPSDDPQAESFERLAAALPGLARRVSVRDTSATIAGLADELARRQADPDALAPPLFAVVYGLHRLRDLRKAEDDFGFGRRDADKPASPAEQFGELLREGPALGLHLLVWCDTLANVTRAVDRAGLREFEMRVLFQMGVADSSTLIDTPLASRLGPHRALFATEELSVPEKFRPYRLPDAEWLDGVRRALARPRALSPA